jgi:hypothetical protein
MFRKQLDLCTESAEEPISVQRDTAVGTCRDLMLCVRELHISGVLVDVGGTLKSKGLSAVSARAGFSRGGCNG